MVTKTDIENGAKQFVQTDADKVKIVDYIYNDKNNDLLNNIITVLDTDGLEGMYGYLGAIRLIDKNEEESNKFNQARGMPRAIKQYLSTRLLEKFRKFAFKDNGDEEHEVALQKMQLRQYLARVGKSLITYVPHGIAMQYVRTLGDFKTPLFQTPYQIGESKPENVGELINKLKQIAEMKEILQFVQLARIAGKKLDRINFIKDKEEHYVFTPRQDAPMNFKTYFNVHYLNEFDDISNLRSDQIQNAIKYPLSESEQEEIERLKESVFGENPNEYAWILVVLRGMFAFNDGNAPEGKIQPKNVPRDSCEYINALNASEGFDMALTHTIKTDEWESYCDEVMPVCQVRPGKLYTVAGYKKMLQKNNRSETNAEKIVNDNRPVKKPAKCSIRKGHEGYDAEILRILRQIHEKQMENPFLNVKKMYLHILYHEFEQRPKFSQEETKLLGLHAFRRAKTNYKKEEVYKIKDLINRAFQDELEFMRGGKTANYLKLTGNPMSRLDILEDFASSRQPQPALRANPEPNLTLTNPTDPAPAAESTDAETVAAAIVKIIVEPQVVKGDIPPPPQPPPPPTPASPPTQTPPQPPLRPPPTPSSKPPKPPSPRQKL